jgi:hypothetical protein
LIHYFSLRFTYPAFLTKEITTHSDLREIRVLVGVSMTTAVFWDATSSYTLQKYQPFGETSCLPYPENIDIRFLLNTATYQSTEECHIPQNNNNIDWQCCHY